MKPSMCSGTYNLYFAVALLVHLRLLTRQGLYHGYEPLGVCLSVAGASALATAKPTAAFFLQYLP
jgi:hypothetical protein